MLRSADEDRGIARNLAADQGAGASTSAAAYVLHDDPGTCDLVRNVLQSAGFDVACSASVFDLLLAEPNGPMRLAIVGMSAIDERGLEIVSRLRARWPHAWIVVVHPAVLRERAARALALGADASLSEPFYAAEVAALAQRGLARTEAGPPRRDADSAESPIRPPLGAASPAAPAPSAAAASANPAQPGATERLALGVARSLRRPIETLEQEIEAAESGEDLDAPAVRAELRRLLDLAEELTGFAGPPDLDLRPADLANLVTGVFVSRDVGAAGAEIGVRIGEARVEILAAPDRLRAGLEALRNRAVRVTPPEGRISVRTRSRVEDGVRLVEISVTDGGPALPDEELATLFSPFARGAVREDESGLELAALAGIVRAHGGTILALAAGATGTIVVIRLPVREAGIRAAHQIPSVSS